MPTLCKKEQRIGSPRARSVVPSFAKPAKRGQPQLVCRLAKVGQPPRSTSTKIPRVSFIDVLLVEIFGGRRASDLYHRRVEDR